MCNWINAAFQENETGIFSVCSSYSSWRILLSDYINENQTLTWQLLLHYWKCDPTRRREGFWWSNLGSLQAEPWRFLPSRWTPLYPRCGPAASAVKAPGKSYQWFSWKTFLKTLALLHLIVPSSLVLSSINDKLLMLLYRFLVIPLQNPGIIFLLQEHSTDTVPSADFCDKAE